MAKAAAQYTDSIYLAASGSEFVEMYVGVGAGRIRDLFKEARTQAQKEKRKAPLFLSMRSTLSAASAMAGSIGNMIRRSINC